MQSPTTKIPDVESKIDFGKKACPEFVSAADRTRGQGAASCFLRDKIWKKEIGGNFVDDTVLCHRFYFPKREALRDNKGVTF
jgi:hypothetical protein